MNLGMSFAREDIAFKTIDGLTLKGWLYRATFGAAVITTPGLLGVKEMFVRQVAEEFQKAGITCLVYDPRNSGESDGLPRNEIDPAKQVSDYSDALSFLLNQPTVDANRVAFWGMSFSATIALCAACLDGRAKLCVAVCPFWNLHPPLEKIPRVLGKCMADRASRVAGNPPTYLPMLTPSGKNPAGLSFRPTEEELGIIFYAQEHGAVNFENKLTLESYYNFLVWHPMETMKRLNMPLLLVIPELDTWSPPKDQMALFETFTCNKKVYVAPGKGHLSLFGGDEFPDLMRKQAAWIKDQFVRA